MKKNKYTAIGSCFAAALLLISCNDLRQTINDTLKKKDMETQATETSEEETKPIHTPENTDEEPQEPILTEQKRTTGFAADALALQEVETSFRNLPELKGKNINIYQSIHFYDNYRVSLKIQNTENPNYVDEYYYSNQKWEGPKPIVLSKNTIVSDNTMPLDKVPFKNAHNVYKALTQKMEEIGSTTTDVTVYVVLYGNKIKWYPQSLSNQRSRYSITFNTDGTLKSFEQE